MGNTMGKELIGPNEQAFATTLIADFMYDLHFDEGFGKAMAEMIAELDKLSDGDSLAWKAVFGLMVSERVVGMAKMLNNAHKENTDGLS